MIPAPQKHSYALGPGVVAPAMHPEYGRAIQELNNVNYPKAGGQPFVVDAGHGVGGPHQHTQYPYVTGTSVLALKYKDGIMVACDTLGSYGSTKRYKSMERMKPVGKFTLIGASGEYSDFHYIMKLLDELTTDDYCHDDGQNLTPTEIYNYLTRVMYNRRNKFDPLWNSLVVGGFHNGESFLGTVGMVGTCYTDSHVATGFGAHLARPLFREKQYDDMSEDEARALLEDGLRVCYYRDKNSINKFQIAKVTAEGSTISEPYALITEWGYEAFVNPAAAAVGTW
ncbi:Proteasome subunit beta type-4 [Cymbomonas tetramitiformis]|uniref:Proteasome subunit beta n=1 Tax=Cymbomonas tetramitiformis TaxID=36881 RepID=A0AAE0F913_9CHLO|nr:Proteasome subunit beta type-4 [Cymbomonas tetramitiformis]